MTLNGFKEVVDAAWGEIDGDPDPFQRLVSKLKRTARQLIRWNNKKIGCMKL
jgi:hypothetical protein